MPYTKLGAFIAGVVFFLGCMQVGLAIGVALDIITEPRPGLFLSNMKPEQAIDSGLLKIMAAVAFGVITEISRSVERK